jgi:dTDP-4-amino-4,6-dideoxygalactose transaminase
VKGIAEMQGSPVPLCDIKAQNAPLMADLESAVNRVMQSGQAIMGPEVLAFEKEAAEYCGAKHAIGCADGTNALLLALAALDVGPGDEVIVPPFTFFATAGSVSRLGAIPVFADIDPITYNIDPYEIEKKISGRTKAIIPVHLFGQCADMNAIFDVAEPYGIPVIEDAAQSFGASYHDRKCGTMGAISCFSFYPSKNLGSLGDAGMVTTSDDRLAAKLKALRVHGSEVKYYHQYMGWNARLDAIHAAILRVKLPHVNNWIEARRAAAKRYDNLIEEFKLNGIVSRPLAKPDRKHTFNQYVVRVPGHQRDNMMKFFKDEQVGCDIYYPLCLHQQECMKYLGHRTGDFPHSENAASSVMALPMFPEITEEQQRRVVETASLFMRQVVRKVA